MGSGETAPTMVKVHRELLGDAARTTARPKGSAVLLDTPFGFQENADEIVSKALEYFKVSLNTEFSVASLRNSETAMARERESFIRDISQADYIFAGPGSPTYALRHWSGAKVSSHLVDAVNSGGTVTFSSAAALTLGEFTLPVYEIYKVGEEPAWREGLGVVNSLLGITAAVIPHFNNREGTNHDTRFCYMGQRRLDLLESYLPVDAYVIGVDEHTGIILDLEAKTAKVVGIGTVTVRQAGRQKVIDTGTFLSIDELLKLDNSSTTTTGTVYDLQGKVHGRNGEAGPAGPASVDPLAQRIDDLRKRFDTALLNGDAAEMTEATLDLDAELHDWGADTLQGDQLDRGRAVLRQMIHALGEASSSGLIPMSETIGPFVDLLIRLRECARVEKDFTMSDSIRDGLAKMKIEIRDTPTGPEWILIE